MTEIFGPKDHEMTNNKRGIKTARNRAVLAGLLLLSLGLAGCDDNTLTPQASAESSAAIPTPTEIVGPDSREDCTTALEKSVASMEDPDRATIRCANTSITVAGNFRDSHANFYNSRNAHDVEQIRVVNGELRAWLRYGDTTCLIRHTPGSLPTQCEPTPKEQTNTPQNTEATAPAAPPGT